MPKPRKTEPAASPWDSEVRLLAWLATCASVLSFLFYFRGGQTMLYGDAVAHINIARRVFDSKTPGLLQLGTVWLPLPHLLMIPFLISTKMWQTGAGGSLPSMAAYVFGVVGIFRLTRGALSGSTPPDVAARAAAWIAALIYAANPNLIYMQSTAMGEAVYLAFFIWAVVFLNEWTLGDANALIKCGLCLAALCFTRYDGWFLAVAMTIVVVTRFRKSSLPVGSGGRAALQRRDRLAETLGALAPRARLIKFLLIVAAAPALWLIYNGIVYRNPLEFENGPYSAKAIERRTQNAGNPGHPGTGNPILAGMYFLKAAEDNVAPYEWVQRSWILILVIAPVVAIFKSRNPTGQSAPAASFAWPLPFLLIPIPFYALSVAYSGVPIFIPQWWPFSHYNVRYGLQLLPAFAVAAAILICFMIRSYSSNTRLRMASTLGVFTLVIASYGSIWRVGPTCLVEAQINMRTRNELEAQLALLLDKLPPDSTLLMYLGDHVGAVECAGIPLKRTINEGNHRVWKQPSDPDGLWERALAGPSQYADYVLAFEGDPVWQAVHGSPLHELVEIHVTGQARAILYRAR